MPDAKRKPPSEWRNRWNIPGVPKDQTAAWVKKNQLWIDLLNQTRNFKTKKEYLDFLLLQFTTRNFKTAQELEVSVKLQNQ